LKNNHRDMLLYELKFRSSSKKVNVAVGITEIIDLLQAEFDADRGSQLINNATQRLIIRDIKMIGKDKDYVAIFVALTDPTIPNAVYTDQGSLESREIAKLKNETGEIGCHLIVKIVPGELETTFVPAYLEQVTGLSASLVQGLLNAVIRGVHKDEDGAFEGENVVGKVDKDGQPKLVKYRPIVEFWGVPAEDLKQTINKGKLQSLTLVKFDKRQTFGSRAYLIPKKQQLTIKLDSKKIKMQNFFDDLMAGLKEESKDWPSANIRFSTPAGETIRAFLDTSTGLVAEERFIKKVAIDDISPVLANSATGVIDHFCKKVLAKVG
jgi:hypothetical protein